MTSQSYARAKSRSSKIHLAGCSGLRESEIPISEQEARQLRDAGSGLCVTCRPADPVPQPEPEQTAVPVTAVISPEPRYESAAEHVYHQIFVHSGDIASKTVAFRDGSRLIVEYPAK